MKIHIFMGLFFHFLKKPLIRTPLNMFFFHYKNNRQLKRRLSVNNGFPGKPHIKSLSLIPNVPDVLFHKLGILSIFKSVKLINSMNKHYTNISSLY